MGECKVSKETTSAGQLSIDRHLATFQYIFNMSPRCDIFALFVLLFWCLFPLLLNLTFETNLTTRPNKGKYKRRQLKFEIFRDFRGKIGMNTTANKFYHISKLIGLDSLNLKFVHFKKIAKIQFLKYGKT